tara:strand:+ start:139 stop:444 length:306 start_codon:yes stop_codon:yes gene_type:complete
MYAIYLLSLTFVIWRLISSTQANKQWHLFAGRYICLPLALVFLSFPQHYEMIGGEGMYSDQWFGMAKDLFWTTFDLQQLPFIFILIVLAIKKKQELFDLSK